MCYRCDMLFMFFFSCFFLATKIVLKKLTCKTSDVFADVIAKKLYLNLCVNTYQSAASNTREFLATV